MKLKAARASLNGFPFCRRISVGKKKKLRRKQIGQPELFLCPLVTWVTTRWLLPVTLTAAKCGGEAHKNSKLQLHQRLTSISHKLYAVFGGTSSLTPLWECFTTVHGTKCSLQVAQWYMEQTLRGSFSFRNKKKASGGRRTSATYTTVSTQAESQRYVSAPSAVAARRCGALPAVFSE